jgi:hypothetical protein
MASRSSSGSRSSSEGRAGSSSRSRSSREPSAPNKIPIFLGSGVAIAASLFVVLSRGGNQDTKAGSQTTPPPASTPAKTPAPAPSSSLPMAAAKAGKTPTTPPPALTQATLQELESMLAQIKTLRNESVTARQGSGDNQTARAKMSEAYKILEQWQQKVEAPLRWQENAQMEDWAQPGEYVTLEKLYATYQRLNNEVRKGGGG